MKRWKTSRTIAWVAVLGIVVAGTGCGGGKTVQGNGGEAQIAGAASTGAAKTSTARAPAEGSHGDRTYVDPNAHIAGYKTVLVEAPKMDTTAERNEKVDDFMNQLQAIIRGSTEQALRSSGKFTTVTMDPETAKKEGKYLVCRNDVLVHFGSTAARILVGFGAGRSKLVVVQSLEDPATGEILLKYTGWGSAPFGYGFQILQKMQADSIAIANYFGGLIQKVPN